MSADNNKSTVFDASQYEFFGQSLEEVELGGLDDDDATVLGGHVDDEEYHLFDKREVSDMDDLATTFAKVSIKLVSMFLMLLLLISHKKRN